MAERVGIKNIQTDKSGQLLIAMIIFYKDPRELRGNGRGVWNVILRDSKEDTINMTVWGTIRGLREFVKNFKFGDIVEVHGPRVQVRITDDSYSPEVSSPFVLFLSDAETNNSLLKWEAPLEEIEAWSPLLSIPTKPPLSYSKLSDVLLMGAPPSPDQERLVNLLVAVSSIGDARTGQTKFFTQYVFRRVTVYDQSVSNKSLPITIWNSLAERADGWTPKQTVLFIADAKIEWKDNRIGISLHHKSIVTENPSIPDADWLREYAVKNTPMNNNTEILQDFVATNPDWSAIQEILTIKSLVTKCWRNGGRAWETMVVTGMMYVGVTGFDIDAPKETVLRPQCSICKSWLSTYDAPCYNPQCIEKPDRFTGPALDLRINLADHTGELKQCRLSGDAAERVLSCSAYQFDEATDAQISALKWHYFMERVVVRVAALPPSNPEGTVLVSILSLEIACPLDTAQNIPMN